MNNLIFHLKRLKDSKLYQRKHEKKKKYFYFHKYFYRDINEVGIEKQ